jgi:hypothetical protein
MLRPPKNSFLGTPKEDSWVGLDTSHQPIFKHDPNEFLKFFYQSLEGKPEIL